MNSFPSSAPQVVVITGASAGVGRATAHRFARAGWRIGLIARDRDALEAVKREVEELGGSAVVAAADVAAADAIFAAADLVENTFGRIDVWIIDAVQHPRREYWIGLSTLKVILGNIVLPSFLDRYLAKVAFEAQETKAPVASDRRDNLMDPVHAL